jgi:Domain of unknown function (DUF4340)
MKFRGLFIAVLVLLVLGGVLYWSDHRKSTPENATPAASASPPILKLDPSSIIRLDLKRPGGQTIALVKATDGKWQITEPKPLDADQNSVSTLLSALSALNSERVVEEKPVNIKQYGLDPPSLELDIAEKSGKSEKILLGDDTPTSDAVYAMRSGDPRVFTTASFNKTTLNKNVNDLRDTRLLTANRDKISNVELIRKGQDLQFSRIKDGWQIIKPKPLRTDSSQVDELLRAVTDARMDLNGSGSQDAQSAFAHANPVASVKIVGDSGTQMLQVRKDKDQYYAKSTAVQEVSKVSADLGHALEKSPNDFRNKKLFDFGFSDPNKIELQSGKQQWVFTRNGDTWSSNTQKIGTAGLQGLISQLRDLTATGFFEGASANPQLEVTVVSDDGKRVEHVAIAKSGDICVAKRDNEPALYQLSGTVVSDLQKAAEQAQPQPQFKGSK